MNGISIIVTAYNTQDYIEECLDSIYAQTWFSSHKNYEVLLGIDHCEETLKKVKSIMSKYSNMQVIYMDKNYGTYITSNTLISMAKYDWILRFDSDDIMKNDMVQSAFDFLEVETKTDIIRFYCKDFVSLNEVKKKIVLAHGVLCVNKSVFEKYGAFMPWICAADSELLCRLKNKVNIQNLRKILFLRRRHDSSLTLDKKTDLNSDIRKKYRKYIEENTPNNTVIKTQCGNYTIIGENENIDVIAYNIDDNESIVESRIVVPVSKKVFLKSKHSYNGI
jgi:glycosyltransferase involved in cell wall biosynthesis